MTHKKTIQCLALFFSTIILHNCTSPVGDMGRINMPISQATAHNFLSLSKLEQKFRNSAALLRHLGYDIAITDHFFVETLDHTQLPITKEAITNSFIAAGIYDIDERFKSINANLDDRHINVDQFYQDAANVIQETRIRNHINNAALNDIYVQQIAKKHKETRKIIREMVFFLKKLAIAYDYVVDQGQLIEPRIKTHLVKAKINGLRGKINKLNQLIE